ncbi:Oidioi.mRNA.OKI2018_I69.XSR.g14189.t1.cds [Oikopleura dioica]|uniref:Oidioi.mRNA.OKI2018_I69.XSR.g14189.t1.cds n=1 Tax=Oikopleura dioica TaxID=34765 RepID=A0ABN7SAV1_OIKDI|nr:Oidioi.mRNA.OKI2018_I69.XSR.g14189.t1.cds [Oikopleura dioica]
MAGGKTVLVVGVTGSGKTCLIRRLKRKIFKAKKKHDFHTTETSGFVPTKIGEDSFGEVGGKLQPLWLDYAQDVSGIIYVIDARAHGRLTQTAVYAHQLREQTQVPLILYVRRAKNMHDCKRILNQWLLDDFRFICALDGYDCDLEEIHSFVKSLP